MLEAAAIELPTPDAMSRQRHQMSEQARGNSAARQRTRATVRVRQVCDISPLAIRRHPWTFEMFCLSSSTV